MIGNDISVNSDTCMIDEIKQFVDTHKNFDFIFIRRVAHNCR